MLHVGNESGRPQIPTGDLTLGGDALVPGCRSRFAAARPPDVLMPPTATPVLRPGPADAVGACLERLLRRRHRRRLRRAGWDASLDAEPAAWAAGGTPPREGNEVQVLIDGAVALPALAAAVREAEDHVFLAFWALDPDFTVVRGADCVALRDLLGEAAERVDVRVLLWAGAPLALATPSARQARRALRRLCAGTRVQGALDSTARWAGACHAKVAVIDGSQAFVGGIDPTALDGDRYDEAGHPDAGRTGWHDVTLRLRGPVVADVAAHVRERWRAATGGLLPPTAPPAPAGSSTVQLLRTVPGRGRHRHGADFSALQGTLAALRSARRFVYLESQFLWSLEVVAVLADKLRRPPHPSFRIVALLPRSPRGAYDATGGQLRVLSSADGGAGRFLPCSLRTRPPAAGGDQGGRQAVYVHAKLVVVDDAWLSVGSLNMSDHGLFNAVEVQAVSDDAAVARRTRERLWAEHLDLPEDVVQGARAEDLVDRHWRRTADEQLTRERAGLPLTGRVVRLPPATGRHRVVGGLQTLVLGR